MMYDKEWVTEWDKEKLYIRMGEGFFSFLELIYVVFRFYTVGVFASILGIGFVYYGIIFENVSGGWMILCMLAGMTISFLGINYSIMRSHS